MNEAHYYKVKGLIERDKNMWNPTDYLHLAGGLMDYIPRLKEEVEGFGEVFESGMRDISKKEDNRELFLECYDLIHEVLDKYLDIPYEKRVIIAIWIVGTYMHDGFETYPYLFLNAMRGSGKTRALKLITELANGKILLSLTEAALFRTTGTIGIDEFESIGSKDKQALRELLNAGYKKGSTIIRMKKKKTMEGEDIVSEEFNPYRPIVMANINGMEEVLGDRCITLILEKSNKPIYTKLIEDFSTNSKVAKVKTAFREALCTWCMNITKKNVHNITRWNQFIHTLYTLHTLSTPSTLSTLDKETELFFSKINDADIDGRRLELYFPLFTIAREISDEVFNQLLEIAKSEVKVSRMEELSESKDISLYRLVSGLEENKYYLTKDIKSMISLTMGDGNHDWLSAKWVGAAIKRLNVAKDKRRTSNGIEVMFDIQKAKDKLEMFK